MYSMIRLRVVWKTWRLACGVVPILPFLALGPLAACKRTAPAAPNGHDGTAAAAIPFVFVSLVEAKVGGRPASSESYYVGHDGLVQVSEESTDGVVHRLRHGQMDTEPFFENLSQLHSTDSAEPGDNSAEPDELPEFFPPTVVLAYAAPSGEFLTFEYQQDQPPQPAASLVARITALGERQGLVDAEPGLFARARRQSAFDPNIETPDLVLDEEAATKDPVSTMLRRETAFIRLGAADDEVVLAESVSLLPDRSVQVQVGQIVYLLMAYVHRDNSTKSDNGGHGHALSNSAT